MSPPAPRIGPLAVMALLGLGLLLGGCGGESGGGRGAVTGQAAPNAVDFTGPRTVVLISLDTLRPDRLGVYGGPAGVSPVLDGLATESLVFDDALAPAPWTLPSHMSMLTGLDPIAHGVKRGNVRLANDVTTLAEILAADGFRTAAFTDGGFVSARFGFDQGFETYADERDNDGPNGFARLLPPALDWMRDHDDEDFFVFVHTFDVHGPYDEGDPEVIERFRQREVTPHEHDQRFDRARYIEQQKKMRIPLYGRLGEFFNDYDAGVFEADRGVGRILATLAEAGRLDEALIIVTSDHGESVFERGLHVGHGIALTDDEVGIPLIVRLPDKAHAGVRLDTTVDLVDIAPTVCAAMGLAPDAHMQGEDLVRLAEGRPRLRQYLLGQSANTESYSLVSDGFKYISPLGLESFEVTKRHLGFSSPLNPNRTDCIEYTFGGDDGVDLCYDVEGDPLAIHDHLPHAEQLFRRSTDPGESHDLSQEMPETTDSMRGQLLNAMQRSHDVYLKLFDPAMDDPAPFDPHHEQQLAQLGYMDTKSDDGAVSKEDFLKMARSMREQIKHPHHPPDMAPVEAIDARVHEVRLALRDGSVPADASAVLEQAVSDYSTWASKHGSVDDTRWWPRIQWRVFEVMELAEAAGIAVDRRAWRRQALQLIKDD